MRSHHDQQSIDDVFLGSDAIRFGLATRSSLRGPRWRRLFRNVFVDAGVEVNHTVRCRGATLILPDLAAVAHQSAAWLWGVDVLADTAVHVTVPTGHPLGPVKGLRIHRGPLSAADVTSRWGIPVTTPARTAWDLACSIHLMTAVIVLDAFARAGLVTRPELTRRLQMARGGKGARRAEQAISLMDGRAESPQESRVRAQLVLANVPPPVPQFEVFAGGTFIARLDLAWPEYQVGLEYDGAWHNDPLQVARDRRRHARLRAAGWHVVRVTAERMNDFDSVVSELRAALALAAA